MVQNIEVNFTDPINNKPSPFSFYQEIKNFADERNLEILLLRRRWDGSGYDVTCCDKEDKEIIEKYKRLYPDLI